MYDNFWGLRLGELEAAGNSDRGPNAKGLGVGVCLKVVRHVKRNRSIVNNLNRLSCDPHHHKTRSASRATGRGGTVKLSEDKGLVPGKAAHQDLLMGEYLLGRDGGQAELPTLASAQAELYIASNRRSGTARPHKSEER